MCIRCGAPDLVTGPFGYLRVVEGPRAVDVLTPTLDYIRRQTNDTHESPRFKPANVGRAAW